MPEEKCTHMIDNEIYTLVDNYYMFEEWCAVDGLYCKLFSKGESWKQLTKFLVSSYESGGYIWSSCKLSPNKKFTSEVNFDINSIKDFPPIATI